MSFAWEVWFVDSSDMSDLYVFKIQSDSVVSCVSDCLQCGVNIQKSTQGTIQIGGTDLNFFWIVACQCVFFFF